jgi:hypothetical protein
MLELVSYGLTGLAAVVVIASGFAYSDEFSLGLEKRSIDLMDKPHWLLSRRSGERSANPTCRSVPNGFVRGEAFHG